MSRERELAASASGKILQREIEVLTPLLSLRAGRHIGDAATIRRQAAIMQVLKPKQIAGKQAPRTRRCHRSEPRRQRDTESPWLHDGHSPTELGIGNR